jgi:glycogen synthase
VIPFDGTNLDDATGFGFVAAHPVELYLATWVGMLNYKDAPVWKTLRTNGMEHDFSWERSARLYDEVYRLAVDVH